MINQIISEMLKICINMDIFAQLPTHKISAAQSESEEDRQTGREGEREMRNEEEKDK